MSAEPSRDRPIPAAPNRTSAATPRAPGRAGATARAATPVIDLDRYVPAYLTWIANKLSRGASQHYLAACDVGIEVWRCLVLLAIEDTVSAQQVSRIIGMDKASVSRCFKSMSADGLITLSLDDTDGRLRLASLTPKGRALHNDIIGIALEREKALLSVLTPDERDTLIGLLHRLHANLPQVEEATARYVAGRYPRRPKRARGRTQEHGGE